MKRLGLAAAALAVAALAWAPAQAQNTGIGKGIATQAVGPEASVQSGTVSSIGAADQTFGCQCAGGAMTFRATNATTFMLGNAETSFAALKTGASVQITYTTGATGNLASTVTITAY